jgi:hypothetical protein
MTSNSVSRIKWFFKIDGIKDENDEAPSDCNKCVAMQSINSQTNKTSQK